MRNPNPLGMSSSTDKRGATDAWNGNRDLIPEDQIADWFADVTYRPDQDAYEVALPSGGVRRYRLFADSHEDAVDALRESRDYSRRWVG